MRTIFHFLNGLFAHPFLVIGGLFLLALVRNGRSKSRNVSRTELEALARSRGWSWGVGTSTQPRPAGYGLAPFFGDWWMSGVHAETAWLMESARQPGDGDSNNAAMAAHGTIFRAPVPADSSLMVTMAATRHSLAKSVATSSIFRRLALRIVCRTAPKDRELVKTSIRMFTHDPALRIVAPRMLAERGVEIYAQGDATAFIAATASAFATAVDVIRTAHPHLPVSLTLSAGVVSTAVDEGTVDVLGVDALATLGFAAINALAALPSQHI